MAEDPFQDVSFTGHIDVYYGTSFQKPRAGNNILGRQFDVRHSGFSLAIAQVNLERAAALGKLGFRLELTAGRNADTINATEPAGRNSFKAIHQAYASYKPSEAWTLDFGKFLTWIGYEGALSADNDNYSRSFLFFAGQPLYHAGLRATGSVGKLSAGLYAVNGWNEVEDSNGSPTFGASLGGPVTDKLSFNLGVLAGSEGSRNANPAGSFGGIAFGTAGQSDVLLGDLVLVYQATPKLKLALNADAAKANGSGGAPDGEWYGLAAYAKYAVDDKVSLGARWETFSDPDSIRTGADSLVNTATLNVDYAAQKDLLFRLEYRADRANQALFLKERNAATKRQETLTLSAVFRF